MSGVPGEGMYATQADIDRWIKKGRSVGATHFILAFDSFSGDNYSVFVMPGESVEQKVASLGDMQKVHRIYDFRDDRIE